MFACLKGDIFYLDVSAHAGAVLSGDVLWGFLLGGFGFFFVIAKLLKCYVLH